MASNFTIRSRRKNNELHINLKGDFDGSSAQMLLNALRKNCDTGHKTYVDTSGLTRVSPFGLDILKSNLTDLKGKSTNIIFIGEHGATIEP